MTQAWYPFYWSDYSGKTMHLSMGQHGAYMLFLRWVYTTEKPIPHKQRYSIARAMLEQERSDADFVLSEFFIREGDEWRSNRADAVINETKNRHERRVNAGKKGGIAKAERSSNARELPEQCNSNALVTTTTTTTTIEEKEPKGSKKKIQKPDDVSEIVWDDFLKHRSAKKAPVTETVLKGIQREADKIGWSLEQALSEACARGWQGFKSAWILREQGTLEGKMSTNMKNLKEINENGW